MDRRQLEYVVAVAEELSFTRAAARCHIAQSGLSHQVARLEAEVGAPLFERTSRAVRLSGAGEVFLPRARRVLQEIDTALAEVAARSGTVLGPLRLGMIPGGHGALDLPTLLEAFHGRHPAVDVTVSDAGSVALVGMLLAGTLDVALIGLFADQIPGGLAHHVLSVEALVAVVSAGSPLASRTSVELAELAASSGFIDCRHDSGLRAQVDLAFARARTTRHVSFELGNLADVARMAALGLGVTVIPESVAAAMDDDGGHRVLRLTDPLALQPVTLVHRDPGPSTVAGRAFVEMVTAVA